MPSDQKRLESWKEIAAYLNREVRTARRWEKERGLPVYRIPGKRSGVYAVAPEIDAWLKAKAPNGSIGDSIIEGPSGPRRSGDRNLMPWAATGVLLLAVALFSNVPLVTPGVPQLRHPVRITNDGLLKAGLRDGGRSLFFVSLPFEHQTLKRISESGIEASVIPFPSIGSGLIDVSHDGTRILIRQDDSESCQSVWVLRTAGGLPKRLADLCAGAAAWSPDGSNLAHCAGRDLYLGNADASNSRRLLALPFERPH